MRFFSDNTATACPEVLDALRSANEGLARAYGDDRWTQALDAAFSSFFAHDVRAFAVTTGTAANALSLATLCPPYGAIFAHEESHIAVDECGAPGFFTGGAQLMLLPGANGKLTPGPLAAALAKHTRSVHNPQPAALSLTQATEFGTCYRPEEIAALAQVAHAQGLGVHMDGARLAGALAYLACEPADLTWRAGVDVLSFGATKNGALAAEAVVFFDTSFVRDFELRRKRAGHLISKSRYVSAQLLAYLKPQVWLHNARRANEGAQEIGRAAGSLLLYPVEANEVFLYLGPERKAALRAQGIEFYDWGPETSGEARFVVSWDQPQEDVPALCRALNALKENSDTVRAAKEAAPL